MLLLQKHLPLLICLPVYSIMLNAMLPTWMILIVPIIYRGEQLNWFRVSSPNNGIRHHHAICLSTTPFCLASVHHYILVVMDPHPWGEWGSWSGVAQVRCRQRQESASEATVTISIYLQPPMAKTLALAIKQLCAISFNHRKAWRWKVKVPAATLRPASVVTDRPVSKRQGTPG